MRHGTVVTTSKKGFLWGPSYQSKTPNSRQHVNGASAYLGIRAEPTADPTNSSPVLTLKMGFRIAGLYDQHH